MKSAIFKNAICTVSAVALLAACAPHRGQNQYYADEVGDSVNTEFARVISATPIKIQDKQTGVGATTGIIGGAAAGSAFGKGDGKIGTVIAGMLIGAMAGAAAEQSLQNADGYKYIVVTRSKKTKTIVQYANDSDVVFHKGDRVLLETGNGFQRLLPTDDLPDTVKRPKDIKVVD